MAATVRFTLVSFSLPLVSFLRLVLRCRQYRGGLDMTPGLDVSLSVRGGALEIGVRSGRVRSGSPLPPAVAATPPIGILTCVLFCPWAGVAWCAPSLGSVGVACRRPLPWRGVGVALGAPFPLPPRGWGPCRGSFCGGASPFLLPPFRWAPWGCGVRTSTRRQAKLLGTCLRLLGSSSYFCLL